MDSYAISTDLLWSRIGRSHKPQPRHRLILAHGCFKTLELLSNTKVEQPEGSVRLDQDVRRLQVSVDDGMLMRILHGFAHRTKQLQPLVDRARVLAAVIRKRETFDVLHDKPRSSVVKGVGVVQPRYGWMIELRECTLLAGEAFPASR